MEGNTGAPGASPGQASTPSAQTSTQSSTQSPPKSPPVSSGGAQGLFGGTQGQQQQPRQAGAPVAAPANAQQQQQQQQQQERKFRRTIDGQTVELSRREAIAAVFDSMGDDEVLDLASLRRGAYSRMEEAAKLRKEQEALKSKLAGSPEAFREWLNMQPDRESAMMQLEQEMTRLYQESMATPEQKRMREYERKIQEMERSERVRKEQEANQKKQAYQKQFQEQFTSQVKEAAASIGFANGVPPIVLQSFALHAEQMLRAGQRVDVQQIARVVQREMREHVQAYLGGLGDDGVDSLLGDRFDKVAALRASRIPSPTPGAPVSAPKRNAGQPQVQRRQSNDDLSGLSLEERFRRLAR